MKGELQRAALYIRVSTDMQTELSPDAQKRLLLEYAAQNSLLVSEEHIYYDEGISGTKTNNRTGFNMMISDAKKKPRPFDIILVHKFSRFARSQEDSIVYKNLLKKQCGISVISTSEPIIEGPYGDLIERIIEWMDEFYSINLGNEVMKGMTQKALNGGYQAIPPLGYTMEPSEIPKVIQSESRTVQRIFELFASGYDKTYIARLLNSEGIKTKNGNTFEARTIGYILQNPFYVGKLRWNRVKHNAKFENDEKDIIIVAGKHEPIISQELFDKVQKRYKDTKRPYRERESSNCKHWLVGTLKCAICGKNMTRLTSANGYKSFQCYNYAKGIHQESQSVGESILVPLVLDYIENTINTRQINFAIKTEKTIDRATIITKMLEKLANKEKRAKAAYLNEIDTIEEYKSNKKIIKDERNKLKSELNDLQKSFEMSDIKKEMLKRISNLYKILLSDADDTKKGEALKSVVEKIIYHKETKSLEVFYFYN